MGEVKLLWCSHCGGDIGDEDAVRCPRCGVGLRGVHPGTLEGRSGARARYSKNQAELRAEASRRRRQAFWDNTVSPLLWGRILPVVVVAVAAAVLVGLWALLRVVLAPLVADSPASDARAAVLAVAVVATPSLSLAVFTAIPVWMPLDLASWWMAFSAASHSGNSAIDAISQWGWLTWSDPRKKLFADRKPPHRRRPWETDEDIFRLEMTADPWPGDRARLWFAGAQAVVWTAGIGTSLVMLKVAW